MIKDDYLNSQALKKSYNSERSSVKKEQRLERIRCYLFNKRYLRVLLVEKRKTRKKKKEVNKIKSNMRQHLAKVKTDYKKELVKLKALELKEIKKDIDD